MDLGFVSEDTVAEVTARQMGMEFVRLLYMNISDDVLSLVSGQILRKHAMIPIEYKNATTVKVAMANPMDMDAIDDFTMITNLQMETCVATNMDIMLTLDKYYGKAEAMDAAQQYAKERQQYMQE